MLCNNHQINNLNTKIIRNHFFKKNSESLIFNLSFLKYKIAFLNIKQWKKSISFTNLIWGKKYFMHLKTGKIKSRREI